MAERVERHWMARLWGGAPTLALLVAWIVGLMTVSGVSESVSAREWLAAAYTVALGFAIGRFWLLLVPPGLIALGVLFGHFDVDGDTVLSIFYGLFFAGIADACLFLGIGISKGTRLPAASRAWIALIGAEAILAIVLLTPLGDVRPHHPHDNGIATRRAQGPILEDRGSYAGIPLGYPREAVKRKHGWPLLTISTPVMNKENEPFYDPLDDRTLGGPDNELKYRDARFDFNGGKVVRIMVYGYDGRTSRGVRIGDPLKKVKRVYGGRCWPDRRVGNFASKARCDVRLSPDRYLYFGEDPIKLIGIATHDFGDAPY